MPVTTGEGFIFEKQHMRVISLKELPSETVTGMFSRELQEGTRFCLLDMLSDLIMVINFIVPPLQEALDHLRLQKSIAFMHQENWLGDKSIDVLEKKRELDDTLGNLFKSGQKIVNARLHFIVFHEQDEKVEEDTGKIG